MANASAPGEGTKTIVRMSAFDRLPWRRMILVALSIGITVFVIWGSYKTLQSNAYSAEAWKELVILGIAQGAKDFVVGQLDVPAAKLYVIFAELRVSGKLEAERLAYETAR